MFRMTSIALIVGTGLEDLLNTEFFKKVKTPYGSSNEIYHLKIKDKDVFYLPRHGLNLNTPPHKVNYRANIWALKNLGAERIISTNAVGAINTKIEPQSLVIPHDIIDFTKSRIATFFNGPNIMNVDVTEPYCPEIRTTLINAMKGVRFYKKAVYGCTEGPRFETPAEIRMMRQVGCDIVGMTNAPEVFLAREMEICYGAICYVSNMAAGIQNKITTSEVLKTGKSIAPQLREIIKRTIEILPEKRHCSCWMAQKNSETRG